MKFTGLFLVLLIFVLNGSPCCADNCNEEDSSENHTESSTGEICSPFFNCGTCTGFVNNEEFSKISTSYSNPENDIPHILEKNYSEYISCIWQPPKPCLQVFSIS